ncbi:MAG: hypothetical protein A3B10_02675 [Candidatus Doudnabacteria bacterium RIFCSPLOWO2_01_FULL_44_21]|uniref:CBS domain-containing protein n=1 Tax=Candidatus Doudnabacteria bacterium RIFCSPLOWO2_01_FULL_44_21 TaxID=1817841 RepID=A0A1F5Q200_9BACT|nr:MAG: hypothetical protein A3B95_02945 [Candidatus Doudnabacteria bacterium RIFCSPHIGHO2_02_FULL_43_13b]OGE96193.1 MAG: hypothetical protein A3B10_02675 [Candidatus Doudnabacteria bacterium RIFCSPLOWO2_01_FULL_44_21]
MTQIEKLEDLMTKQVVTVTEDTPLTEAVVSVVHHRFSGLPVVDRAGKLVGLFTEKKLLADQSYVHLRTLLTLFSDLQYYKKKKSAILEELKEAVPLDMKKVMNPNPRTLNISQSIEDAHALFLDPATADPVPVVDDNNVLKGVLSLSDFAKYYKVPIRAAVREEDVDRKIDRFAESFRNDFLVVPRFRVYTWIISSILFGFAGFAIAMFFILRISV